MMKEIKMERTLFLIGKEAMFASCLQFNFVADKGKKGKKKMEGIGKLKCNEEKFSKLTWRIYCTIR
jgi:hypothetical protein